MRMGGWTIAVLAAGLGFALAKPPAPARGENLQQAWGIALDVNERLQAQQLESVSAGLGVAAARSARLPTVTSYNLNAMLSNSPAIRAPISGLPGGTTPGLGSSGILFPALGRGQTDIPLSLTMANLPLYTGGRLLRNIDAAQFQADAQRSEEFRTALDLKLTVAEAYIGVLRARRDLEVARSDVERLASFARDVRNRREEGLAIRSDELAATVSLANARLGAIRARTALESAWSTYNRYLGRPMNMTTELEELTVLPDALNWSDMAEQAFADSERTLVSGDAEVAALTERALRARPELAGLEAQARSQGAQAESTLATVRPQAGIGGGFLFLGSNDLVPQGYGVLAFTLNWTITDGGVSRRRAEALRQQERATYKRRCDTAADIALQVRTRWLDLQQAHLRVPVARVAVAQAEENLNVVTDRYRQQLSTYTEVLDAESRRVQSLTNFYDALYDENLATIRLRRTVGDL